VFAPERGRAGDPDQHGSARPRGQQPPRRNVERIRDRGEDRAGDRKDGCYEDRDSEDDGEWDQSYEQCLVEPASDRVGVYAA
jgi:hypothetical protein